MVVVVVSIVAAGRAWSPALGCARVHLHHARVCRIEAVLVGLAAAAPVPSAGAEQHEAAAVKSKSP
jgi:hypothetical protein